MYAYCLSESKYLTKSKKCPNGPQSPLLFHGTICAVPPGGFWCTYISAFIQSFPISTCKNYAYWCNILTFRVLSKEGKAYHSPCYSCGSRNQPIIAHKSGLRTITLSRSKCSKSQYFDSICILFTYADVEWLNEHAHEKINMENLTENAWNNLGQLNWTLPKERYVPKLYGRFVTIFLSTWTICHTFILDDLSQVIWHACHNFSLDNLSQVIFVLDDMSQKKNSDLWWYVGRYGRFATIVFHTAILLDGLSWILGKLRLECMHVDDAQWTSLRWIRHTLEITTANVWISIHTLFRHGSTVTMWKLGANEMWKLAGTSFKGI